MVVWTMEDVDYLRHDFVLEAATMRNALHVGTAGRDRLQKRSLLGSWNFGGRYCRRPSVANVLVAS